MNGTGNMLIDEPTIYIAVIYIRYILEQSVRVDGLEYFVKHPRTGGCVADGSPQLPPLQVYECVCVSVSYKQCGSFVWGTRSGIKCHMNVYF